MSRLRPTLALVLAVAPCVVLLECDEVDVIVARAGATVDGGALQPCKNDGDCARELYCATASCSATAGTCETRPLSCDNTLSPVCGCDGVVYWNDCLRQRDGVASSVAGQCTELGVTLCDSSHACPVVDAFCTSEAPEGPGGPRCEMMPASGVCWVLPDSCPEGQPASWRLCERGPDRCTDLCTAILSGLPYHPGGPFCQLGPGRFDGGP